MRMMNKKAVAGFEMMLMLVSLFAFTYFVGLSDEMFGIVSAVEDDEEDLSFREWLEKLGGRELIEEETRMSYPISSSANGIGCCFVSKDGQKCGTAEPDKCVDDSPFAEGALCGDTSFCQKGCCFDEVLGIYDKNVLKLDCWKEWVDDPNCNMPAADLGCCVLGANSVYETEGQCRIDSLVRALGDDGIVDWRRDVGEMGCLILGATQEEGACLIDGGSCKFVTDGDCFGYGGDFNKGYLCSSPSLNTSCEMTRQTGCIDGKDGVYFLDSCGNAGNVYDAERVEDVSYWNKVMEPEDICGSEDIEGGNANSVDCGNCDRFAGGICASASENGFKVEIGEFYCRDTSCMFDGKIYRNGESWCIYDGTIGNGDDVVGSRHWKYVCSQGVVQVEPCADYRNQICVQTKEFEIDGEIVKFENAACIANNWRKCIDLNSKDDSVGIWSSNEACVRSRTASLNCGNRTLYPSDASKMDCVEDAADYCGDSDAGDIMGECAETLNCRVETIDIADKFKFDVCLPKYPAGFDLSDERYMASAERLCGMADQTCTVIRKPKTWGGCKYVANENCLREGFAQEMNDFCRGLGDCGGSVNILGEYSENYVVRKDGSLAKGMFLSDSWIVNLAKLAIPVDGQFAEVEDYSEYLAAAGVWGGPEDVSGLESGNEEESGFGMEGVGRGLGGIGSAINFAFTGNIMGVSLMEGGLIGGELAMGYNIGQGSMTSISGSGAGLAGKGASMAGFASAAIGAGIGMVVGGMIAKQLGLSEGGSMLMGIGGAMIGAQLGYTYMMTGMMAMGPIGWIGLAIMVIASFFGGSDCPPIEIEFECKPWVPLHGGDDCGECNNDPLKPCSKYRCESLGAGCVLVNEGSENEMCSHSVDDGSPPIIRPQVGFISENVFYDDEREGGFSLSAISGGCIDAYTPLMFGVMTSELARCKFDPIRYKSNGASEKSFEEMSYDLGANAYLYNHTTVFSLPDPSHGQSQGANWTGELSLFVKCQDVFGHESPGFYEIGMCVNEGPDESAPKVVGMTPENGALIGFDAESVGLKIVTNELATCRWSESDVSYSEMGNEMICGDVFGMPSDILGYVCSDVLPAENGTYYIKCGDQPWLDDDKRNFNFNSFVYTVRKSDNRIAIDWIEPSRDFETGTDMTTIDLKVSTSGGGEFHFCSYSFSGYDRMVEMFETGNDKNHSQILNRPSGMHNIFVECRDETGDFVRSFTSFKIVRDSSTPTISRVWQDDGNLYFVTSEKAECRYSIATCKFGWENGELAGTGEEHSIGVVHGETYYIKCRDSFGNVPADCSTVAKVL